MLIGLSGNRVCQPVAAKANGHGSNNDDLVITGPVGFLGITNGPQVIAVQNALNNVPSDLGGFPGYLDVDGVAGDETIGAIRNFQKFHFGFNDGKVDVMGKTHAKLSSLQPMKIQRMEIAKQYLSRALSAMLKAQTMLMLAGTEYMTGGGLTGGRNLAIADSHFDVLKSADVGSTLNYISSVYKVMLSTFDRPGGLGGWMQFEAEPFYNKNFFAYTWWGGYYQRGQYIGWQRMDTVYLSGYYDKANENDKVQTIIHELAHFIGPASGDLITDYAYGKRKDMMNLSPYQKQHNAESYGNFALSPIYD